ncbi:hypothetical protein MAR_022292 [Mya arenaria]|uniref:Secreted protein n=1 Tax=Mya arenaria TaxID=6604 RepID=A0ABY7DJP2_MYAAR|nr:hypothetical protein MAR_022292 [Mya arenaria]
MYRSYMSCPLTLCIHVQWPAWGSRVRGSGSVKLLIASVGTMVCARARKNLRGATTVTGVACKNPLASTFRFSMKSAVADSFLTATWVSSRSVCRDGARVIRGCVQSLATVT